MRILSLSLGILLGFFLAFVAVSAVECGQTPTDHCTISQDTTFTPGVYQVENITIIANNTLVDCSGAELQDKTYARARGVFHVGGTKDVTIKNCTMKGSTFAAISNNV